MPSAVVSRIAPSSSALARPAAEGSEATTAGVIAAAISALGTPAFAKINASADSSSHEIVNRCASVAGAEGCSLEAGFSGEIWLALIVTGVPVSDVLLVEETPG